MEWNTQSIVLITLTAINCIVLFTMKFNDLRHLEKDVSELKGDFKHYVKKLYSLAQRIARLEGINSKNTK